MLLEVVVESKVTFSSEKPPIDVLFVLVFLECCLFLNNPFANNVLAGLRFPWMMFILETMCKNCLYRLGMLIKCRLDFRGDFPCPLKERFFGFWFDFGCNCPKTKLERLFKYYITPLAKELMRI